MIELCLEDNEAYWDNFFTFLKAKFNINIPVPSDIQKNTSSTIYYETISALESLQQVLRKIKNDSAFTYADYEAAKSSKDERRLEEIFNFCQKIAFFKTHQYQMLFQSFISYYDYDAHLESFLSYLESQKDLHEVLDQFSGAKFDAKESLNFKRIFDFISRYKEWSVNSGNLHPINKERLDRHNHHYSELKSSYDRIIKSKISIGSSVFDVRVKLNLYKKENSEELAPELFAKLISLIHEKLRSDIGVLLSVNHIQRLTDFTVQISFLVIYKQRVYKSHLDVYETYRKIIVEGLGSLNSKYDVINRQEMVEKVFPTRICIGELNSIDDKRDFFANFVRFFLSSIFILSDSYTEDEKFESSELGRLLNNFFLYENHISIEEEQKPKNLLLIGINFLRKVSKLDQLTLEIY